MKIECTLGRATVLLCVAIGALAFSTRAVGGQASKYEIVSRKDVMVPMRDGNSGQTQQAHIRNFLDAVRSRKRESLNQEIYSGHVSTAMCHAGNISWRTGKKLRFDAQTETFDDEGVNQYVGREHRKGFELPDIA